MLDDVFIEPYLAYNVNQSILHKKAVKIMLRPFLLSVFLLANFSFVCAQKKAPPTVEKQFSEAAAALQSGDLDGAEKIYTRLLAQGQKMPVLFYNLGVIAQLRNQHAQALIHFRSALNRQNNFAPAYVGMGISLLATGKYIEAGRALETAVQLQPQDVQIRLRLIRVYETQGDWLGVVEQYRTLRELQPQEAEYAYQLGRAYTKLTGWSYQRIARLNPRSARLAQAQGQNYLLQEKYDLALEAYQSAAQLDPTLPEIHLALALIYLEQKNYDAAQKAITQELKLMPESQQALAVQQKIKAAKGQ